MRIRIPKLFVAVATVCLASISSHGAEVMVTVENLQPAGGLFFTPTWVGFHNGTFDALDVGSAASAAIEAIAEEGDTAPLVASFAGNGVDGVVAPGSPFGPSGSSFAGSSSQTFSVDAMSERYFSYASMVIPSNDAFFANDNPMAYSIFDAAGNYTGPVTINITGSDIWDAGTEANDAMGAAFSALGGTSSDEVATIGPHPGLDNFIGTGTANGETILSAFNADSAIARITVTQVPEPSSFGLISMAALSLLGLARRRR
jgi:hypothetical protein